MFVSLSRQRHLVCVWYASAPPNENRSVVLMNDSSNILSVSSAGSSAARTSFPSIKRLSQVAPYVLLLVFTLLAYRAVLFQRDVFIPWDLPLYHLPQAAFAGESLRSAELPLWDPNTYCGRPITHNCRRPISIPHAFSLSCWFDRISAYAYFADLKLR
jgi:hypothetical protein